MGLTNFPNGISSFGIPIMGSGVPATFGDVYFVDYRKGSDGNKGKSKSRAFKTLSKAYASVTSNNNDVILIDGDSEVVETAMIDWSKNRVHVIGLNGALGHYGPGARVSIGVTTDTADIALLQVTGVRNTFTGIKFGSSNTLTQAKYCVADAGEYTRWCNCEFIHTGQAAVTTAAEILCNGDSSQFYNCTIGGTAYTVTATSNRACLLFDREIVSGKVARDNYFENCLFLRCTSDADNLFAYWTATNDAERFVIFKNCIFINNTTGGTTMTVGFKSAVTNAIVLFKDCVVTGTTNPIGDTNNSSLYIYGTVADGNTTMVPVQGQAS